MFELLRDGGGRELGWVLARDEFTMFFGRGDCDEPALEAAFSDFTFCRMRQVHGDTLIEASPSMLEADALWTAKTNTALVVSTADCLPVLIAHREFVCAVHAGWRGVKNEILLKSLRRLSEKFSAIDRAVVAVGPHIHVENFEVDRELGRDFLALYDSYFEATPKWGRRLNEAHRETVLLPHERPEQKVYLNLLPVARAQLLSAGISASQIHDIHMNTYGSNSLASYRRDRVTGRNLSFVARRK